MRISDWSSDVCSSDLQQCTNIKGVLPPDRSLHTLGRAAAIRARHPGLDLVAERPATVVGLPALGRTAAVYRPHLRRHPQWGTALRAERHHDARHITDRLH